MTYRNGSNAGRRPNRPLPIRIGKMKVCELIDRYGKEITPTKRSGPREKSKIKILMASKLAQLSVSRIQPIDVVNYRKERGEEVGPATVTKEMNLLSHMFNIARTEWGMSELVNPVQGVRRPRQPKGRERRLYSIDESERILRATRSPTLKTLLPLAIETAMRRGEMVAIRLEDISLEKQVVQLHQTKNGKSRTVPLSFMARDLLGGIKPLHDGRLYSIRPGSVTRAFIRALKRARATYEKECEANGTVLDPNFLVDLRFHDMRHEATSRFLEDKNLSEVEVMSITGHGDSRELRRYTQLRAQRIAQKLG